MPYIPKGAQTEVGRKIEELAKKVPGAKYILPDPYEGTNFLMPLSGLTKMQYIKALAELGVPGRQFAGKVAKKILRPIEGVYPLKELPHLERFTEFGDVGRLRGGLTSVSHDPVGTELIPRLQEWMGRVLKKEKGPLPGGAEDLARIKSGIQEFRSSIGFGKEPRVLTAVHEPGHIMYSFLTQREKGGMAKAFDQMESAGIIKKIQDIAGVSLHNPKELVAEGYAQYIAGTPIFKEFHPFVKHLIKKYHRLAR